MELMKKQGYKQTEVGLIPDDWKVKEIGTFISNLKAGVSVNSKDNEIINIGITPSVLKTSSVSKGKFYPKEAKTIIKRDISRASVQPIKESLIISRMNTPALVGECGYVDKEYRNLYLPDRLWQIEFSKDSKIDALWLSYIFSNGTVQQAIKDCATGTSNSMKNIPKESFLKIKIPLSTLTEQKAIATALSDVDALITSLEQTITKKKAIKQGAMQQLLTPPHKGGKRLPGFSGEWVEKTLGELASMNSGGTPSSKVSEYYDGNIKWVSISDISKAGKYIDDSAKKITEKGLQNSSARLFQNNTLLLAMYASIGKCCISLTEVTTSQAILGITTTKSLLLEFLYYFLTFKQDELANQGQQGTQSNLNKGMVQDILLNIPKIAEQKAIAQILSDMDAEITQLETKKEKYQAIKQGMMQELLTGKTRLK